MVTWGRLLVHGVAGRDVLATAMSAAGLVNYPAEWWHSSYGDQYWAFQAGRFVSRAGRMDQPWPSWALGSTVTPSANWTS
jgi:hypothetical protein